MLRVTPLHLFGATAEKGGGKTFIFHGQGRKSPKPGPEIYILRKWVWLDLVHTPPINSHQMIG